MFETNFLNLKTERKTPIIKEEYQNNYIINKSNKLFEFNEKICKNEIFYKKELIFANKIKENVFLGKKRKILPLMTFDPSM